MIKHKKFVKHIQQIKRGGITVIIKKLLSLIFLILQIPIYLISIPTIIIIRLISHWFLIRWKELWSSRIGHFTLETDLYCSERESGINCPPQRYLDLFYLKKIVSNKQLEKMWRRKLIILPSWLLFPLFMVNRFFNTFVSGGLKHEIGDNTNYDRDVHNLCEKFPPHISFTNKEELEGKRILKKFGIPEDAKLVCLAVRDSGYLARHNKYSMRDFTYHNYRDGDIDKYVLAAEELARRGYYVFRMGTNVLKPLKSSNPKVIDYANSVMRSDFMDVYLGAKCSFCVSTAYGFDGIPYIFRKPIAYIFIPLGELRVNGGNENFLLILKYHISKKNNKKLSISEIFSSNTAMAFKSEIFESNNIILQENDPEEIRDLVIEMDERLNGNWTETDEDLFL